MQYEETVYTVPARFDTNKTETEKWQITSFLDWTEFVNYTVDRKSYHPHVANESSRKGSHGNGYEDYGGGRDWYGGATFEQAIEMAKYGWPEGAQRVKELSNKLYDKVSSLIPKQEVVFSVEGNEYDTDAYLAGIPECWSYMDEHIVEGVGHKDLKLYFNTTTSAGVNAKIMQAKGACITALVDLLERAGNRVEVWLGSPNQAYSAGKFIWQTCVKQAGELMDVDKMAFAISHPSSFRRLFFAAYEGNERFIKDCSSGYGMCVEAPKQLQGDIYIPSSELGQAQWDNEDSAVKWIMRHLETQGIKAEL